MAVALAIVFKSKELFIPGLSKYSKKPELLCCKYYRCICCIDLNLKNESHMTASDCCRMVIVIVDRCERTA